VQTLFNFNPLIKLDGYYLLSDWLAIPNLQQRGIERFRAHARRLMWGGPPPDPDRRGRVLTGFGVASWCFSVFFLCGLCLALFRWAAHSAWGGAAMTAVGVLSVLSIGGLFSGFLGGEAISMLRARHLRTLGWFGAIGLTIAGLFMIEIEDRTTGPFVLRAETRAEIQAPVAGFLRQVYVDEGDRAAPGMVLCRLEVPELAPRLARKRAERETAAAQLALLQAGTRAEEVAAQRLRVERATAARDLAAQHLGRSRTAHAAESDRRQQQISVSLAELKAAESALTRARGLREQNALSASDFDAAEAHGEVCRARVEQARAEHRAHAVAGVLEEEQELALRTRELGEAQSVLTLMEAGTRPEEITAQEARVRQLEADICELEAIEAKQTIACPAAGDIVTPHLRDKLGQYFAQGALICEAAETERLTAEVALTEDAARRVDVRQRVHLQPRGLTSESVETSVWRIAPAAVPGATDVGKLPSTITVACDVSGDDRLRPGMSGYARIDTGRRSIAAILHDRVHHYIRTEFWW
jgi:multidrug efflux pump subunit AcrA (membrane-fusion protein)